MNRLEAGGDQPTALGRQGRWEGGRGRGSEGQGWRRQLVGPGGRGFGFPHVRSARSDLVSCVADQSHRWREPGLFPGAKCTWSRALGTL